MSKIQKNRN